MGSRISNIRIRAFRLFKNGLILGFALFFLNMLQPMLSFINFEIEGLTITGELVLRTVSLLFIIYFGYFILIDAKYFLDFISIKLGSKEQEKAKSLIYDVASIISLILASQLLTPFLVSIRDVGIAVAEITNIVLLVIGFVIAYHLISQIYHLVRNYFEKI